MGENRDKFHLIAENEFSASAENSVIRTYFYAPPSEFEGCFTTFYHLVLDLPEAETVQDYLQPEWANIRFFGQSAPLAEIGDSVSHRARFTATGPSSHPCKFDLGSTRMWGIGFLPSGWARFVNVDASDCVNIVCDGAKDPVFAKFDVLSDVLCDTSISPDQQLAFLQDKLRSLMRPNRDEAKILRVHNALVSGEIFSVNDLAETCGMSIRTVERMCLRYFGFTPKRLLRRQRFMRSLSAFMLQKGARWTEAMDQEYHDQAQFTREFREFMTMSPSEYAALDHPILASFMEARARIWGAPAQALDSPDK